MRRLGLAGWLLAALLLVVLNISNCQYRKSQADLLSAQFATDSIQAVTDSQKTVLVGQIEYQTRRAVQTEFERDALSRQLGTTQRANIALLGQLKIVRDSLKATGKIVDSTCTENCAMEFSYEDYNVPFTLEATFTVNPADSTAELDYEIYTDPMELFVRLECSTNTIGVKKAIVAVQAPDWFDISMGSVTQTRDICNPPAVGRQPTIRQKVWYGAIGAGLLYGAAWTADKLFNKR